MFMLQFSFSTLNIDTFPLMVDNSVYSFCMHVTVDLHFLKYKIYLTKTDHALSVNITQTKKTWNFRFRCNCLICVDRCFNKNNVNIERMTHIISEI